MNLTVERTFDRQAVKYIMTRPDMWPLVAEDGHDPEDFEPDVTNDCWLTVTDGEKMVALYNLHAMNSVTVQGHVQVLPEFRDKYSRASILAMYKWMLENAPEYKRVVVYVPEMYSNVSQFVIRSGFFPCGYIPESYSKGGILVGQDVLSISAAKMAEEIRHE